MRQVLSEGQLDWLYGGDCDGCLFLEHQSQVEVDEEGSLSVAECDAQK